MNPNVHSHPGYLYQISRNGNGDTQSILKQTLGMKEKEQALYVYLTPTVSSLTNPFNNHRLKSIMNEAEIVVFDSPPEKEKSNTIEHVCELLQKNYNKETLLRINTSLTESLKSSKVDITKIDEKVGDNSEKLTAAIALKVLILLSKNLGIKQADFDSTVSTDNHDTQPIKLAPKQQIHKEAEETGKTIEYIDERAFIEKNKNLLFDKGFLELMLSSFITDQELVRTLILDNENTERAWNTCTLPSLEKSELLKMAEKNRVIIDLKEKWMNSGDDVEDMLILSEKINTYLSSKKKTLLVLEKTPQDIQTLKPFLSLTSGDYVGVNIKGPIKEPTGCFWKIKKNDATIGYLLGSIHRVPKYLLDLNSRIRKCFDKSNRLAVEIDVTREDIAQATILERHQYWAKQYSTFSSEQTDRLSNALKKLMPEEAKNVDFSNKEEESAFIYKGIAKLQFRIWSEQGISLGIDPYLIIQAKNSGKIVESLETQEQYAQQKTTQEMLMKDPVRDLFANLLSSKEMQEIEEIDEMMRMIIEQMSIYQNEALQPLFDAWEEGDLEKFDFSKTDSIDRKMDMTQRNMNMAMKITHLVNEKEKTFFCVGAAHTVGEMSIQAFLKNFGFSIERVLV